MSLKRSLNTLDTQRKHVKCNNVRCYYNMYQEEGYILCDAGFVVGVGDTIESSFLDLRTKAIHILSVIGCPRHIIETPYYIDIPWAEIDTHKKESCIQNI